MQQLGVILAPYGEIPGGWYAEIAQSRGSAGQYLKPFDPQYNMRGERGWYYDTQLGTYAPARPYRVGLLRRWWINRQRRLHGLADIPTDAELSIPYGYTPVNSGWIKAKQGYITGPWRFGWDPAGAYGPPIALSGSPGLGSVGAEAAAQSAAEAVAALQAQQAKAFKLSLITTAAIALSAAIAIARNSYLLHQDVKRLHRDVNRMEK